MALAARKVAVVVGVGPGLGASVARRFAKEGFSVALVARKAESLTPVHDEITAAGGVALSVPTDTGVTSEVKAAYATIKDKLGDPEVLVYNASAGGVWPPPAFLELDPEAFKSTFNAGVVGAMAWSQAVLPHMIKESRGTLLFTGATASLRGGAKFANFACAKFALRALSQSLAREFQPQGVHVAHVIIDGQIDHPKYRAWMPDRPVSSFLNPDAIADTYWHLHTQDRTAWTLELELRPAVEKF